MKWRSVIDADGRPMVVSKNPRNIADAVARGGIAIDSYPPRVTERYWKYDGANWVIDVEKEQAKTDSEQDRKQDLAAAKQAYRENKTLLESPTWSPQNHQTLHDNILIMMRVMGLDD